MRQFIILIIIVLTTACSSNSLTEYVDRFESVEQYYQDDTIPTNINLYGIVTSLEGSTIITDSCNVRIYYDDTNYNPKWVIQFIMDINTTYPMYIETSSKLIVLIESYDGELDHLCIVDNDGKYISINTIEFQDKYYFEEYIISIQL